MELTVLHSLIEDKKAYGNDSYIDPPHLKIFPIKLLGQFIWDAFILGKSTNSLISQLSTLYWDKFKNIYC